MLLYASSSYIWSFLFCMRITMSNPTKKIDWKTSLQCKECCEFKEVWKEKWYLHKEWYLWVLWRCKECIKKWRKSEKELSMARIRDKERYQKNSKRRNYIFENAKKMRKEKWYWKVHSKTNNAIKRLWIRPKQCSVCWCHNERIEAHHWDYSKWNEITFACSICHSKLDMWKIKKENCAIVNLKNPF